MEFFPVGGLGNQLFSLYAAIFTAQELGLPSIKINLALRDKQHNSSLESLDFSHLFPSLSFSKHGGLIARFWSKVFFALGARLRNVRNTHWLYRALGHYSSKAFGTDPQLRKLPSSFRIRGYFQTKQYVEDLKTQGLSIRPRLKKPSVWFDEISLRAELERPIGLHVRGGDFLNPRNNQINLPASYYENAISVFRSRGFSNPIWVISDDHKYAEALLEHLPVSFVSPPQGVDPAESLLLLASLDGLCIANSTFSWWAAMFGDHKLVIAPEAWSRADPKSIELIPSVWLRVSQG